MSAAASLRERAAGYFVAPRPPAAAVVVAPRELPAPPMRFSARAAVLGSATEAAPLAGALANALRGASEAPAAAVALWAPTPASAARSPRLAVVAPSPTGSPTGSSQPRSAPATPAALRLAARLTARGLPAVGRGRLAWLRLDDHPVAAAVAARRVSGALEAPLVLALAGPRTAVLEGLLREQDLVVVVTREPAGALARLAVAASDVPAIACAPLASGPARLLALAGLSGARALDAPLQAAVQRLAGPPDASASELRAPTADPAGADW